MTTLVDLEKVYKVYQQGGVKIPVLHNVDFKVSEGEAVAILGASGAGKSTLIALIAGLDIPETGEIKVAGNRLGGLSEYALSRFRGDHIGIVFQQFHLMKHLTALENVALPLEIAGTPAAMSSAMDALDKVGLKHRSAHLPHQLSGGECQRVAIARAFVVKPRLLLADEPSGNLDQRTGDRVMDLLFRRIKEETTTMILVTHNESLAKRCDRQLLLENGDLREYGGSL